MDVQHGAACAAELAHVLCFDPTGELVIRARVERDLHRPTNIAALLGRNLYAVSAAVSDVGYGKFAATAVRRGSPAGWFAVAQFLERSIWNEIR